MFPVPHQALPKVDAINIIHINIAHNLLLIDYKKSFFRNTIETQYAEFFRCFVFYILAFARNIHLDNLKYILTFFGLAFSKTTFVNFKLRKLKVELKIL